MATVATLVIGLAGAAYSAYSAHEQKQEQKAAITKQKEIQENEARKRAKKILAQQEASFLASGISLTGDGTPQDFFDETKTATAEDMNMINDYYSTQIGNVTGRARAQYIQSIGSAVQSTANFYSATQTSTQYSGQPALQGAN